MGPAAGRRPTPLQVAAEGRRDREEAVAEAAHMPRVLDQEVAAVRAAPVGAEEDHLLC